LALCCQLSSIVTDAVWRHVIEYATAESFHVLHMGPMSDDAVPNQLLSPHLCGAMPLFGPLLIWLPSFLPLIIKQIGDNYVNLHCFPHVSKHRSSIQKNSNGGGE
jgi:hypothetical protein